MVVGKLRGDAPASEIENFLQGDVHIDFTYQKSSPGYIHGWILDDQLSLSTDFKKIAWIVFITFQVVVYTTMINERALRGDTDEAEEWLSEMFRLDTRHGSAVGCLDLILKVFSFQH